MRPEFAWVMGVAYVVSMDVFSAQRQGMPVDRIVVDAQTHALAALAALLVHQRAGIPEPAIARTVRTLKADVGACVRRALKVEQQHAQLTNELSDKLALALLTLNVRATPQPEPQPEPAITPRKGRLIELEV
jgi:hypothetical protein